MHNSLDELETFLGRIQPNYVLQHLPVKQQLISGLTYVSNEVDQIRKSLTDKILEKGESKNFEIQVQHYQRSFNFLLDVVIGYKSELNQLIESNNPDVSDLADFYNGVISFLEDGIVYLVKRFEKYIDLDVPASLSYCTSASKELQEQLLILNDLYKDADVDPKLLRIIVQPILEFIELPHKTSYRRIKYLRLLVQVLKNCISSETASFSQREQVIMYQLGEVEIPESPLNINLHLALLSLNFNSPEYIHFSTTRLWHKMTPLVEKQKMVNILRLYSKLMKQIGFNDTVALRPGSPPTTKQISDWIDQELEYIQARDGDGNKTSPSENERGNSFVKFFPIRTNFTVPELLLFIKLFCELNIFIVDTPFDILKSVASLFTTIGSEKLNPATLRGRWWNRTKTSTIDSLMEKLRKAMEILRSWRG